MAITVISGDTHTQWQITPVTDVNSTAPGTPISLTGAVSAAFRFLPENLPAYTGTGTATIGDGTVNYFPSSTDLATYGPCEVQISITYSDTTVLPLQPLKFAIYPAI